MSSSFALWPSEKYEVQLMFTDHFLDDINNNNVLQASISLL